MKRGGWELHELGTRNWERATARWRAPPGVEREYLQKLLYEVEDTFEIRWRDFVRREGEFQPRPGETPEEAAERHGCFTLEPTDPKLVDAMNLWQDVRWQDAPCDHCANPTNVIGWGRSIGEMTVGDKLQEIRVHAKTARKLIFFARNLVTTRTLRVSPTSAIAVLAWDDIQTLSDFLEHASGPHVDFCIDTPKTMQVALPNWIRRRKFNLLHCPVFRAEAASSEDVFMPASTESSCGQRPASEASTERAHSPRTSCRQAADRHPEPHTCIQRSDCPNWIRVWPSPTFAVEFLHPWCCDCPDSEGGVFCSECKAKGWSSVVSPSTGGHGRPQLSCFNLLEPVPALALTDIGQETRSQVIEPVLAHDESLTEAIHAGGDAETFNEEYGPNAWCPFCDSLPDGAVCSVCIGEWNRRQELGRLQRLLSRSHRGTQTGD